MPGRAETSRNGQLTPLKVEEGRPLWDGTFVGTWVLVVRDDLYDFVTWNREISNISNFLGAQCLQKQR